MWKSLHAAAFYTPGSPPHSASRQHWGQLIWLARPACSQRTAARAHCTGQTAPIQKSPALALECRGFFCSALMETMPEGYFHFPHQLTQKVENSPLCGLLPGAGGLLTDPLAPSALPQGGAAPGKLPHPKLPGTRSGMPGIFLFRSDGDHAGKTLLISTAAAAEGGKLSPVRAFAGRRRSAHRSALSRRTAARAHRAGQTAPSKNPRHSPWNAGDFFIYL